MTIKITGQNVGHLAKLTNDNRHTEAIAYVVKLTGDYQMTEQAKELVKRHLRAGSLTDYVAERREALYKAAIAILRTHADPDMVRRLERAL